MASKVASASVPDTDTELGDENVSEESGSDDEEKFIAMKMSQQAVADVRRQLKELKAVYRSIKQRNNEIPEKFRIKDADLRLPDEIYAHVMENMAKECDEVYRVHEYESAETIIQLDKIIKFYFDPVETPHIVVKDISHELQVHTIRNRKMTPEFQELVVKNSEIIEEEKRLLREQTVVAEQEAKVELPPVKRVFANELIGDYESKIDSYDVETVHNIRHLEKRLDQKYERECAWQELMGTKIPADFIPPEDLEVLAQARNNTGAYNLQAGEAYVSEQISMAERRQKILNMKLEMREEVQKFNQMVIEARDEKPLVVQECRRLEKEIRKVHVLLPEEYRRKMPAIFDMEPDETPEKFMDITQEQVEAEEQSLIAAAGLQNIALDIMEECYGVKKPTKDPYEDDDDRGGMGMPPPPAARAARQAKTVDLEYESVASHRCRKVQFTAQSEMGRKKFEVQFYPRLFRQEILFKELLRVIGYFHERIKFLHDLRLKMEIESKVKTVGLLSMINELDIAKEYTNQDQTISEVLKVTRTQARHAKRHLEKLKKKLVAINSDMKKCEHGLFLANKEAERAIGTGNKFADYLWRVFRKPPVQSESQKNDEETMAIEGNEIQDQEEEESPKTDSEPAQTQQIRPLTSDKSRGRLDLDVCPENLKQEIYDKVVESRVKRLATVEEMEKLKKAGEEVSAEHVEVETLLQKYQERTAELGEEIRVLQRRRQKRMNDLKLMIILRADQIQCMNMDELAEMDGEMLEKLAQSFPGTGQVVIFPKGGTGQLEGRADELVKKGKLEMEKFKRGKKMLLKLQEEYHKVEKEVESLRTQVKQEMTVKFGQEVDLDKICTSVINLELNELESQLEQTKTQHYKAREKVQHELNNVKYKLTKKIEENSKYNMLQAVMLERRRDLEYYIWKNEPKDDNETELAQERTSKTSQPDLLQSRFSSLGVRGTVSDTGIFNQLDDDIEKAKTVLERQQERMQELKQVLTKCRTKSGMPPLIPISTGSGGGPSSVGQPTDDRKFTRTANEMPELNQYCVKDNIMCGVQTLYQGDIDKCQSHMQKSMENVDYISELATRVILGDESEYSASVQTRDLKSTSDVESSEGRKKSLSGLKSKADLEFMKFMEESQNAPLMFDDEFEAKKKSNFAAASLIPGLSEGQQKTSEVSSEKDMRAKGKIASRKSLLEISDEAKNVTEDEVMDRIRRYSLEADTEEEEEAQDDDKDVPVVIEDVEDDEASKIAREKVTKTLQK